MLTFSYSPLESSSLSSSLSSMSSSVSCSASSLAEGTTTVSAMAHSASSNVADNDAAQVRDKIAKDLNDWQDKFAKAADKGTEDLDERVREITERQIKNQVRGVGEALVVQLETSTTSELSILKKSINNIVKALPADADESSVEKAESELNSAVRNAGLSLKSKAQALRSWKQRYDEETYSLVDAASQSTLDVIDEIRDLGLQEIGMRWAWMEGVTYKDWSKYHALKKTFDEWRSEVVAVAKEHESLPKARMAAEDLESRGMGVAEDAAKELARLKEAGKWKIHAGDASDDFGTKILPAKAAVVGQKIIDKVGTSIKSAVDGSQGSVEYLHSQVSQQAVDGASKASSHIIGTESNTIEQAVSKVSEALGVTSQPTHESVISSAIRKLSEANGIAAENAKGFGLKFISSAGDISSQASEAVAGTSQPKAQSVVSAASKKVAGALSKGSEAVKGTPAPMHESVASEASKSVGSVSSGASSVVSQASKKVFAGAMAQEVQEQKPIFDEDISDDDDSAYSEKIQSVANKAGEKYADVSRAVSEALVKATTTQGSVDSATSLASEHYSSAMAAASSVLYGSQAGAVESVSSAASERFKQAVAAYVYLRPLSSPTNIILVRRR